MPIDIQSVLVCDAVDPSCVELLKSYGISVDYKLKLPKDVLVEEAKVKQKEQEERVVTSLKVCNDQKFSKYSASSYKLQQNAISLVLIELLN